MPNVILNNNKIFALSSPDNQIIWENFAPHPDEDGDYDAVLFISMDIEEFMSKAQTLGLEVVELEEYELLKVLIFDRDDLEGILWVWVDNPRPGVRHEQVPYLGEPFTHFPTLIFPTNQTEWERKAREVLTLGD